MNFKYLNTILIVIFVGGLLAFISYANIKGNAEKKIDEAVWDIYVARDRISLWKGECYHKKTSNYNKLELMTYRDFIKGSNKKYVIKRSFLNKEIDPKSNIRIALKPILYECKTEPYIRKSHLVFRSRIIS